MVPDSPRPVILGRDFLVPEDLTLLFARGGYVLGTDWATQQPFVTYNELEYRKVENRDLITACTSSSKPTIEDVDSDDQFEVDMMLWTQMVKSEEIDIGKEPDIEEDLESLFSDECEFLKVPIQLEEDKKEMLREAIRPFLDIFSEVPGDC